MVNAQYQQMPVNYKTFNFVESIFICQKKNVDTIFLCHYNLAVGLTYTHMYNIYTIIKMLQTILQKVNIKFIKIVLLNESFVG